MKRAAAFAALVMVSGCMSTARNSQPVSLGYNRYEIKTYEEKATLYPRLEAFCRAQGGVFAESFYSDHIEEKTFYCNRPHYGPRGPDVIVEMR